MMGIRRMKVSTRKKSSDKSMKNSNKWKEKLLQKLDKYTRKLSKTYENN